MTRSALSLTFALAFLPALPLGAQEAAGSPWKAVDAVFGAAGKDLPGGVHRFGWPRRDLHVQVGDVPVQPALALGSWGAFLPAGNQTMAMGDLVLLEPELTPVVTALIAGGWRSQPSTTIWSTSPPTSSTFTSPGTATPRPWPGR